MEEFIRIRGKTEKYDSLIRALLDGVSLLNLHNCDVYIDHCFNDTPIVSYKIHLMAV